MPLGKDITLREAFKIFDRNKDGLISMKELKKVTSMLGTMLTKEEVEEFMAEADLVERILWKRVLIWFLLQDGNGELDYDEFVKMLMQY